MIADLLAAAEPRKRRKYTRRKVLLPLETTIPVESEKSKAFLDEWCRNDTGEGEPVFRTSKTRFPNKPPWWPYSWNPRCIWLNRRGYTPSDYVVTEVWNYRTFKDENEAQYFAETIVDAVRTTGHKSFGAVVKCLRPFKRDKFRMVFTINGVEIDPPERVRERMAMAQERARGRAVDDDFDAEFVSNLVCESLVGKFSHRFESLVPGYERTPWRRRNDAETVAGAIMLGFRKAGIRARYTVKQTPKLAWKFKIVLPMESKELVTTGKRRERVR